MFNKSGPIWLLRQLIIRSILLYEKPSWNVSGRDHGDMTASKEHLARLKCFALYGKVSFFTQSNTTQNLLNIKNTKNRYTRDALGAIFATFTILDTFTKLLQYFYNTITILLQNFYNTLTILWQYFYNTFTIPLKYFYSTFTILIYQNIVDTILYTIVIVDIVEIVDAFVDIVDIVVIVHIVHNIDCWLLKQSGTRLSSIEAIL